MIGAVASVGVADGTAASPTAGAVGLSLTTTFPIAWIFRPPTGSARTQYLPGFSMLDPRHEDRPDVGAVTALDADLLGASRRLDERLCLQAAGEPDPGARPRHDAALPVDDEERQPDVAWAEIGGPGDDRNVLAGSAPESFECGVRLLLR